MRMMMRIGFHFRIRFGFRACGDIMVGVRVRVGLGLGDRTRLS